MDSSNKIARFCVELPAPLLLFLLISSSVVMLVLSRSRRLGRPVRGYPGLSPLLKSISSINNLNKIMLEFKPPPATRSCPPPSAWASPSSKGSSSGRAPSPQTSPAPLGRPARHIFRIEICHILKSISGIFNTSTCIPPPPLFLAFDGGGGGGVAASEGGGPSKVTGLGFAVVSLSPAPKLLPPLPEGGGPSYGPVRIKRRVVKLN